MTDYNYYNYDYKPSDTCNFCQDKTPFLQAQQVLSEWPSITKKIDDKNRAIGLDLCSGKLSGLIDRTEEWAKQLQKETLQMERDREELKKEQAKLALKKKAAKQKEEELATKEEKLNKLQHEINQLLNPDRDRLGELVS
jgi:uncharacterized protein (DUF3084 family)